MKKKKRVLNDGFFLGLDKSDTVIFEYSFEMGSGIHIVGKKDPNGDFFLIEIDANGMQYNKILQGGASAEVLDLSTEEAFFQANTITDLGMSYDEYTTLHKDFMTYYNGFLDHLTVFMR